MVLSKSLNSDFGDYNFTFESASTLFFKYPLVMATDTK